MQNIVCRWETLEKCTSEEKFRLEQQIPSSSGPLMAIECSLTTWLKGT